MNDNNKKREIKFRVWDILLKCFFKSCEIYDCYIDFHKQDQLDCSMNYLIFQQYTGLKDKNGKEIYEGDIVKGKKCCQLVEWNNAKAGYSGIEWEDYNDKVLEVIGNIFENSELL